MKILEGSRHNFSKGTLLFGNDIKIEKESGEIVIEQPKYGETLSDLHLTEFFAILNSDLKSFEDFRKFLKFKYETRAELIYGLTLWSDFGIILQTYFSKYVKNISFEKNSILINNEKIKKQDLEDIGDIILTSMGYKGFKKQEKLNKTKPKSKNKRIQELLEKEQKVKEKLESAKKNKSTKGGEDMAEFEDYFIGLSYEFGIKLKEIYEMTGFALGWHISFLHKIDVHKVQQLQFGNGVVGKKNNKYQYFVDK